MIKIIVVTLMGLGGALVVPPAHTQPVLGVKPVVVQHFSDLSEPNDIQPALGVNVLQQTYNVQPQ